MADEKKLDLQEISSTMMKLFVNDVFNKNGITEEKRQTLSSAQKEQLKKVVADLQSQVDEFVKNSSKAKNAEEEVKEAPKNVTLRDMLRNKKK